MNPILTTVWTAFHRGGGGGGGGGMGPTEACKTKLYQAYTCIMYIVHEYQIHMQLLHCWLAHMVGAIDSL